MGSTSGRTDTASDAARVELARTHLDAGESLRINGKPRDAEREYRLALAALKRPADGSEGDADDRRTLAMILIDLGQAQLETGRPGEARDSSERAVTLLTPLAD